MAFCIHRAVRADEYQNSLLKLFGDSRGCAQGRKCDGVAADEDLKGVPAQHRKTVACTLANQCHAYRNASAYLSEAHYDVALRTLKRCRFFSAHQPL